MKIGNKYTLIGNRRTYGALVILLLILLTGHQESKYHTHFEGVRTNVTPENDPLIHLGHNKSVAEKVFTQEHKDSFYFRSQPFSRKILTITNRLRPRGLQVRRLEFKQCLARQVKRTTINPKSSKVVHFSSFIFSIRIGNSIYIRPPPMPERICDELNLLTYRKSKLMMKKIPYGRQNITEEDIEAVLQVLKSDYLTQGPQVGEFEKAFSEYIGCKYALAVSNGTAALHLSIMALGVKKGDKVITTPMTFVASANCVRFSGGDVVFADTDPQTGLLDINEVRTLLEASPRGTYHGIIPVDLAGRALNLELYRQLADEFNLWILEDACHAPGGYFYDKNHMKRNCGNGDFSELSIFSFHPVKHFTTGEGGMITTNNKEYYLKLKNLRTHGIQQDQALNHENHGLWYYEMQELGFNYRMTDIQAALGISQLKRADKKLEKRRSIASYYNEAFKGKPYVIRQSGLVEGHAYHLYVIEVEDRPALYNYLREKNIFTQVHYVPVHLMPYYRQFGWKEGDFPHAENYYKHCLSLPIFPTLKREEQNYIIQSIEDFYS